MVMMKEAKKTPAYMQGLFDSSYHNLLRKVTDGEKKVIRLVVKIVKVFTTDIFIYESLEVSRGSKNVG